MKKQKKKIKSYLLLLLLFTLSCVDGTKSDEELINSLNIDTFEDFASKEKFVKEFNEISTLKNIMFEFDIKNSELISLRRNYFQSFIFSSGLGHFQQRSNKFIFAYIYDDSFESTIDKYGYIFACNNLIIKKLKDRLIYLYWENKQIRSKHIEGSFHTLPLINRTTQIILTNIDSNVVRKKYNYKGLINNKKLSKIVLNFDQHLNNKFFKVKDIYIENNSTDKSSSTGNGGG